MHHILSITSTVALLLTGVVVSPASADLYPPCTINGSSESETITGTSGADVICNGGGDDTINALEGNDVIVIEGPGVLVLDGGAGDDTIDASKGTSSTIRDDQGSNRMFGTDGVDTIYGGSDLNRIESYGGNDLIYGGSGIDRVKAGAGDDLVWGGPGDDELEGGEGVDTLDGQAGADNINGDGGNDYLTAAGPGREGLGGGDGDDFLLLTGPATTYMSGGDGDNILDGRLGTGGIFWGGRGDDSIWATPGDDQVGGGGGSDQIYTYEGNDKIDGRVGEDSADDEQLIFAGPGNDIVYGAYGPDVIYGEDGNDKIEMSGGDDLIYGGNGDDKITESSGVDTIYGGEGNDTIDGGIGDDILLGENGNDTTFGSEGNDNLSGGAGNDSLGGGEGTDILDGGEGTNLCDYDIGETTNAFCSFDGDAPEFSITRDKESVDIAVSEPLFINVTLKASDLSGLKRLQYSCRDVGYVTVDFDTQLITYGYTGKLDYLNSTVNARSFNRKLRMIIKKDVWPGLKPCSISSTDMFNQQTVKQVSPLPVYNTIPNQPSAPTNLKFNPTSPTSGSLVWTKPKTLGSPAMSSYSVQYSVDNVLWTTVSPQNVVNTSANLTGLPEDTNFTFRVRGNNGVNLVRQYDIVNWAIISGSTSSSNVNLYPTKLKVSEITTTSFKLNWVAPKGGAAFSLAGYRAEISSNGKDWALIPISNIKSTSITKKGIIPGTSYQVRLAALNGARVGAYVYSKFRTVSSVPGVPTEIWASISPTSRVYLKWKAPTFTGGEQVTSYQIDYSEDKGKTWRSLAKTTKTAYNFQLTRWKAKPFYYYRVSAVNKIGKGKPSSMAKVDAI